MNKWMPLVLIGGIGVLVYFMMRGKDGEAGTVRPEYAPAEWWATWQETGAPPAPTTEAEMILAQARIDAMYAGMYPGQDEALVVAANLRTPEQHTTADRVAIARYSAKQRATSEGKSAEEVDWAGRVAGSAALQGISEAEATKRFKDVWAKYGYTTPPI